MSRFVALAIVCGLLAVALAGTVAPDWTQPDQYALLQKNLRAVYPSAKHASDDRVKEFADLFVKLAAEQPERQLPGGPLVPFNCKTFGNTSATSVHALTAADISVTLAIGDSLTAAFGAEASSILWLFEDYRESSFSDGSFSGTVVLPNLLRAYNPTLTGYSIGDGDAYSTGARGNVAVTGDVFQDIMGQAEHAVQWLKAQSNINMAEDWKLLTLFIGCNNLCVYCEDPIGNSAENYYNDVEATLDYLQANVPRLFVALVPPPNVTELDQADTFWCSTLHSYECNCAVGDASDDTLVSQATEAYYNMAEKLSMLSKYTTDNQFTVVMQPYFLDTNIPRTSGGEVDYSYFAPDCFHFSTKGQQASAVSLFNNLFEPVGSKAMEWDVGEQIVCPTQTTYLATVQNSRK